MLDQMEMLKCPQKIIFFIPNPIKILIDLFPTKPEKFYIFQLLFNELSVLFCLLFLAFGLTFFTCCYYCLKLKILFFKVFDVFFYV